jgi:hypothetical protein
VRRLLIVAGIAVLAAIPITGASAETAAKRAVCHYTGSAKRPYVKIRTSARVKPADIAPAPAGACPKTRLTAAGGGTALQTNLAGEAESPAGDPVGTGTATIRVRRGQGQLCYSLKVNDITLPAAGAHIHSGGAGTSGPIVVPFTTAPGADGTAAGCVVAARPLVAQLLSNGANYYVNVHTTDYPGGAIRGQLGGALAALGTTVTASMNGAQECNATACNVGDADANGTAVIRFRPADGQVCFRLTVQNVKLPSVGAHIHQAARGVAGAIVVPFQPPDASGKSTGCTATAPALINQILGDLSGFYANVHSTEYPGGAVRGQLG